MHKRTLLSVCNQQMLFLNFIDASYIDCVVRPMLDDHDCEINNLHYLNGSTEAGAIVGVRSNLVHYRFPHDLCNILSLLRRS